MKLRQYMQSHRLLADGAMGTYYVALEGKSGNAFCEEGNLSRPEVVLDIHRAYIRAGAGLIRTNTFAASACAPQMDEARSSRIIEEGCRLAKQAVSEQGGQARKIFVAGSIGPIRRNWEMSHAQILAEYGRMVDIFLKEQVDALIFETFSDLYDLKKLIPSIREKSDIFIIVNFCINKNGYTASGISAQRLMDMAQEVDGLDACGFNCGVGSGHMKKIVQRLRLPANRFFACMPNAGYPDQMYNRMVFVDNSAYFAENMADIGRHADIAGGCCGTSPAYIRRLSESFSLSRPKRESARERKVADRELCGEGNPLLEKLKQGKKVVAVELDPPFDASYDRLVECGQMLKKQGADVITMADSPMGRSRVDSVLMGIRLAAETGMNIMPHICCRDKNRIAMRSTLLGAYINGIRNLLLVTGDPVPGMNRTTVAGVFDYNSIQLMDFVKEMNREHFEKDPFVYGGALNVSMGRINKIVERVKRKQEAGASYFMTQPVYSKEEMERLAQVRAKTGAYVLCGIMPFVSYKNACFMQNEFIGIRVPQEMVKRYHPQMSREEGEAVGAAMAAELVAQLADIANGYYFMFPFNRVGLMEKIRPHIKGIRTDAREN